MLLIHSSWLFIFINQVPGSATSVAMDISSSRSTLKFCTEMLKMLKKHRDAGPFLVPVDPIALGIPQYFEVIKTPMDFSTIEKKLTANEYDTFEDFVADVRLILNNCFTFNPPDHAVHKMGRGLERFLNAQLKKVQSAVCSFVYGAILS